MKDWQKRVMDERYELAARLTKLSRFLSRPETGGTARERSLLFRQLEIMDQYLEVLNQRISLWKEE